MRAADQDARAGRGPRAGANRDARRAAASGAAPGASASRSAPRPTWPRQIRPRAGAAITPATGVAIVDQRDVDGVFVAAGEELARAVERIDQEEAPAERRRPTVAGRLLRDAPGRPAASCASPSRMTASDASSAAVTGERSGFSRRFRSRDVHRQDGRGRARGDQRETVEQVCSNDLGIPRHDALALTSAGCDLSHRRLTLDARIA